MIIGITTPLSRSIAWPAPNCCAALLSSLNVVPKVITDAVDNKALKRRAKEIAESEWAAAAVRKAVQEVQAAVTAAIVVASSSGAASS